MKRDIIIFSYLSFGVLWKHRKEEEEGGAA